MEKYVNENNLRFQYFWILSSFELLAAKFEKNSVLNIQEPGPKSLISFVFFALSVPRYVYYLVSGFPPPDVKHDIIFIHGFMIA